jgi:hypothetical protein
MQPQEEPYRFGFQHELLWKDYLKDNGFVVIKDWLNR